MEQGQGERLSDVILTLLYCIIHMSCLASLSANPTRVRENLPLSASCSGLPRKRKRKRDRSNKSQFDSDFYYNISVCCVIVPAKFMRFPRVKANGQGFYHCVSRVVEGRFILKPLVMVRLRRNDSSRSCAA